MHPSHPFFVTFRLLGTCAVYESDDEEDDDDDDSDGGPDLLSRKL